MIVASGLVNGKSAKQLARDAGCSVDHAKRLAADVGTAIIVTQLLARHRKKLEDITERCVDVVEAGLQANRKDPEDHGVRLKAVERARDLLEMAEGKQQGVSTLPGGTMEELLVIYRRISTGPAE